MTWINFPLAGKKHRIREDSFRWTENPFLLAGIKPFPPKNRSSISVTASTCTRKRLNKKKTVSTRQKIHLQHTE